MLWTDFNVPLQDTRRTSSYYSATTWFQSKCWVAFTAAITVLYLLFQVERTTRRIYVCHAPYTACCAGRCAFMFPSSLRQRVCCLDVAPCIGTL